jgi:hypothetical protein
MHRFFEEPPAHGTVVFNFQGDPVDDLWAWAKGYHEAGRVLSERIETRLGGPDYEGYPVPFLYRHSLELSMKAVVFQGARFLGLFSQSVDTTKLFADHALTPLLTPMREIASALSWSFEDTGFADFEDFAEFVRSLDAIDAQSFSFRYPVKKSGAPQLSRHFVMDVVAFARHLDGVLDYLELVAVELHDDFRLEGEARDELARFCAEWR